MNIHLRLLHFVLFCCVFSLASCATVKQQKNTGEAAPSRISAAVSPEAETAFAQARVLWKKETASVKVAEVCSDPEKALILLNKAITIEPDYADAYARRGLAKSDLGDREGAFDDATTAIRLRPSPEFYAYRGLISMRSKQMSAAQKDLEYSTQLDASQHLAWNLMGVLALTEDDKVDACEKFKKGCSQGDCSFMEAAKTDGTCR